MKITDLQLNESLTQEGMWDSLKGKLARTPARPMQQRQEPVMTAEPAPAVWKNARNPGAPAATSPQAAAPVPVEQQPVEPPAVWKNARNPGAPAATSPQAAVPSTAPADVEPEEPAPAVEPAAAVNTRPKGSGFLTRLGQEFRGRAQQIDQEFRGRAQQNQVNAANEEMVNARVNAWKQASQGLDPNNTEAYQTALKTWAQKNFPSADPAVIDQAAASVTPTGWGSNSQQVQAITDIFNNHITNKQIGKTVAKKKTRTGGKVAGQVSQTPNAIRKRAARAGTDSTSAPNPFGQMANTMRTYAPPETTSTGGTLTQTPTGQVHKASATNPNAQPAQGTELDLDQLKAQRATKLAQGQADQQNAIAQMQATANPNAASTRPAAPKVTKVTTGGPTPDERAKLDQRIQQLAQKPAPVQKESFTRDFGAMLWTKMRDSK